MSLAHWAPRAASIAGLFVWSALGMASRTSCITFMHTAIICVIVLCRCCYCDSLLSIGQEFG